MTASTANTILEKHYLPKKTSGDEFVISPQKREAEIEITIDDFTTREVSYIKAIPLSLRIVNFFLLILSILFFSQFFLTFFNKAVLHGSIGLVASIALFGLFKVFTKVAKDFKYNR